MQYNSINFLDINKIILPIKQFKQMILSISLHQCTLPYSEKNFPIWFWMQIYRKRETIKWIDMVININVGTYHFLTCYAYLELLPHSNANSLFMHHKYQTTLFVLMRRLHINNCLYFKSISLNKYIIYIFL